MKPLVVLGRAEVSGEFPRRERENEKAAGRVLVGGEGWNPLVFSVSIILLVLFVRNVHESY